MAWLDGDWPTALLLLLGYLRPSLEFWGTDELRTPCPGPWLLLRSSLNIRNRVQISSFHGLWTSDFKGQGQPSGLPDSGCTRVSEREAPGHDTSGFKTLFAHEVEAEARA